MNEQRIYLMGYSAYMNGANETDNPYHGDFRDIWWDGFNDAWADDGCPNPDGDPQLPLENAEPINTDEGAGN